MKKTNLLLAATVLPCVFATAHAGSQIGGDVKIEAEVQGGQLAMAQGAFTEAMNLVGSIRNYNVDGGVTIDAVVQGMQLATSSGVKSKAINAVGSLYSD
jgi:hypothetical protein